MALNDDALELPGALSCLQIYGLYVHTDYQRQGLRQRLIESVVKLALMRHPKAVLVNSFESAVTYFKEQEFRLIPLIDEVRDYPYRLVRSII